MQFCSECHNMYYLKIQDEDENIGNTLIYYCRNCGHEDTTLSTTNICVSDTQLRSSEKKYTHIVNEYTKYDPTLPRINTIKCPNQECSSNEMGGGGRKKTVVGEAGPEAGPEAKAASKAKASKSKAATSKAETSKSKAAQASLAAAEENLKTILEEEDAAEAKAVISDSDPNNNREVIYIRYDDTNMKYVYLCVHCDTTWRTDNRL